MLDEGILKSPWMFLQDLVYLVGGVVMLLSQVLYIQVFSSHGGGGGEGRRERGRKRLDEDWMKLDERGQKCLQK